MSVVSESLAQLFSGQVVPLQRTGTPCHSHLQVPSSGYYKPPSPGNPPPHPESLFAGFPLDLLFLHMLQD